MIWIITSPERIHDEAAYLNELAAAGPVTLLVRKPGWSLEAYTRLLDQLHDHSRVMVAGFPELLTHYNLMGLHVSETARLSGELNFLRRSKQEEDPIVTGTPVYSTSIHSPQTPAGPWNYLLLGPVFDSISKAGYTGKGHLFQAIPPNSIAVGGVQAANVSAVKPSLAAGEPVEITDHLPTIADGIAIKRPGDVTLPIIRELVDDVVEVTEEEIARGIYHCVQNTRLVVEGAGGLMVPLNGEVFMLDLIRKLEAKVIVVAQNYLGSINHCLLTAMALKQAEIPVVGWIFNGDHHTNEDDVVEWSHYPRITPHTARTQA